MIHEVTVPSITTVLLSAACFAVAEATRLAAKCSETVAAAIDGAYMVSLATVVVLVCCDPSVHRHVPDFAEYQKHV